MKDAIRKDRFMEIIKTKARFLSILSLIALGIFVYTGLKSAGTNMRETIDNYFNNYNMPDITVKSSLGLDTKDQNILKNIEDIENIEFGYFADYILDSERNVIRIESEPNELEMYDLLEGNDLKEKNDILLDIKLKDYGYELGQEIEIKTDKMDKSAELKNNKFNIVGYIKTPKYISKEDRGKTNIGSGNIFGFGIIKSDNFNMPVYSIAKIKFKDLEYIKSYTQIYEKIINKYFNDIDTKLKNRSTDKYKEIIDHSNNEIQKAEEALNKARKDLEEGKILLDIGKDQIKENKRKLALQRASTISQFINIENELQKGKSKIKEAENKEDILRLFGMQNSRNIKVIEKNIFESEKNAFKLQQEMKKIEEEIQLIENKKDISSLEIENLKSKKNRYRLYIQDYNSLNNDIENLKNDLNSSLKNGNFFDDSIYSIETAIISGKNDIREREKAYRKNKKDTEKIFKNAYEELKNKEKKYKINKEEYYISLEENKEKIANGEKEIIKAKEDLNKLETPIYYIESRLDSLNFYQFIDNSKRIDMLSNVFPVFFFTIAILVSLTTMTRMVDEQRNYIGTLKALGYSNKDIVKKFTHYGFFSSIIGMIIGASLGTLFLSKLIFKAYAVPTNITNEYKYLVNYKDIIIASLISLFGTVGSSYIVCRKELKEKASLLMKPKAPKMGSRIFLERIKIIWNKMNFIQKVTARNIFRYKKRMFMTIIGVAGCTALIFMGLGLKSSISGISKKQYGEIFKFDCIFIFNTEKYTSKECESIVTNNSNTEQYAKVNYDTGKISIPKYKHEEITLIATDDKKSFSNLVKLRNEKNDNIFTLNNNGIIISEKLANESGLKVGDSINFKDRKNNIYKLNISGINQNYAGEYFYMSSSYYEKVFSKKFQNNAYLVKAKDNNDESIEKMEKEIMKNDQAIGSISTNYIKNIVNEMIKSLNIIIFVILICASLLAIVVIYNLTNINIAERNRELSTIKVLGFFDKEVTSYVYRETIILSIIGIVFGLIIGIFLHKYVLISVEPPIITMDRITKWYNYIISSIVTLSISIIVMYIIHKKLKNINMIESLKSVE